MAMNRFIVHCKCIIMLACSVVLAYLWFCDRIENHFGERLRERLRLRQICVMTIAMLFFIFCIAALSFISIGMEYYLIRALVRALTQPNYIASYVAHAAGIGPSNSSAGAELLEIVCLLGHFFKACKHMALAAGHIAIVTAMLIKGCVQHPAIVFVFALSYSRMYCAILLAETVDEHEEPYDDWYI